MQDAGIQGRWLTGPDVHIQLLGFAILPDLSGIYVWYTTDVAVTFRGTLSCCVRGAPGSGRCGAGSFCTAYEITGRATLLIPERVLNMALDLVLPTKLKWLMKAPKIIRGVKAALEWAPRYQRVMRTIRNSPGLACLGSLNIPAADLDFGKIYLNENGTRWTPPGLLA